MYKIAQRKTGSSSKRDKQKLVVHGHCYIKLLDTSNESWHLLPFSRNGFHCICFLNLPKKYKKMRKKRKMEMQPEHFKLGNYDYYVLKNCSRNL